MKQISRRSFIQKAGFGVGGALLANAGLSAGFAKDARASQAIMADQRFFAMDDQKEIQVLVGDVLGFNLSTDKWEGHFGSVRMQMHKAMYNGQPIYYVRTDASDRDYALENKVVYVPLLNAARSVEGAATPMYTFENGADDQYPVVGTVPNMDDFSPARQIHSVTFKGDATLLNSVAEIMAAEAAGDISIEATNLVLNLPVVKWHDGELTADTELVKQLAGGPLVEPVDVENMTVNFKLHECFPGSRYIVTDTSAVPMAPMMSIGAAGPTGLLQQANATDEIWVFGNGVPGGGAMGFQPGIFDNKAGNPVWSPFWDHFTALWNDESEAYVVSSSAELRELVAAGKLEIFNGTPNTHPGGFVVNCPVPIVAPNTFKAMS